MSPAGRAETAPALADAFGSTFWIAIGLIAVALLPALLPKPPGREAASEKHGLERKAA